MRILDTRLKILSLVALGAVLAGCSGGEPGGADVSSNSQALQADLFADHPLGDEGLPEDYDQTLRRTDRVRLDAALPAAFNWADEGVVTPAKSQGGCGSCWAFAAVGALEAKLLMAGEPEYDLSELQQVLCNGSMSACSGGNMGSLRFWETVGPQEESCTGYDYTNNVCDDIESCGTLPYRTANYYTVSTSSVENVKTSLYEDGPTYFRYTVYSDFDTFWGSAESGDVYTHSEGTYRGGHAVLIIGWDDAKGAYLFKNSWGETDGPNGDGTFWMSYDGHTTSLAFGMANVNVISVSGECISDVECDDGVFCNGAEVCVSGSCEPGESYGSACENATEVSRYESVDIGTTEETWYVMPFTPGGWWVGGDAANRTISVNGQEVVAGEMPLPDAVESGKYYFHFGSGETEWANFGTW